MNEAIAQLQKKLEQMFPTGQWTTGQKAWAVKDGMYFCHAADIVDGEIVLTELGKRLINPTPVIDMIPETFELGGTPEPVAKPKKSGKA